MVFITFFGAYILVLATLAATDWGINRSWKCSRWVALGWITLVLGLAYGISRHALVPYHAEPERRDVLLTGDEPDYLLTAYSIAKDGDLDVSNNIRNEDWQHFQARAVGGGDHAFFNRISKGRLSESESSWGDARYMQHRPGISTALAPIFLLFKGNYRWWAYLFISSTLIGFGLLIVFHAHKNRIPLGTSTATILIFLLSPPILFYASQVYPEAVCGVLLSLSLLLLANPGKLCLCTAPLLALAMWFSDRALISIAILSLLLLFRLTTWKQRTIAIFILAVSALLFAHYCYQRFGVPWPLSHNERLGFEVSLLPRRFIQILFDSRQGWFWQFPLLLLTPIIFPDLLRSKKPRLFAGAALLAIIAMLAVVAAFDDWRGGTNPRGRYYVMPQLMLLPVFITWLKLKESSSRLRRAYLLLPGSASVTMLFWLAGHPNWWFRPYHPLFGLKCIQPYYGYLPSLADDAPSKEWLILIPWLLGLGALLAPFYLNVLFRKRNTPQPEPPA
jgi:hypothetical protein